MGIRGILRAAVLLLLIRTWLAEGNEPSPTPKFHFELSPTVPEVILNLFNCKKCANEAVVHKILDRVLSNYDVRLRPNFGGAPVPVGVSMYVSSIEQISEMTMDYTITMFFHQTWKDPRLAYHETDLNLTLDYRMLEKLWVPDCYFLNSKDAFVHDVTVENRVFQLHPDGTVRYGMRLTTTAPCSLDLQKFPLDKQTCKLEVESYGYTVEDIVLYWEGNGNAIQGTEKLHIPQFSFLGKTMSSKEVFFYTGSYVRLILRFLVQREVTSYLVQIYWPTVLTTVISWISFWMNYESSAARVTVGLTSMLILNAINSHLRDKLPQVACIKAIDIYMVICFLFVFLSLLEYVYINYLYYSRGGSRRNQRRRRRARRVMARYRYREVMLQPFANRRSQEEMILSVEEIDTHIATVDEESPLSPPPSPPPVLIHVGLANPDAINVSTISLREDQISIEDESGSLSSRPARACLASLESLSSLTSIPGQAPLATAESLSSLSSLSELASLASRESLSDLPSTPEQAPHRYGIHVNGFENDDSVTPTEIRNLAEAHDHAEISDPEDPEENFSLDESPVHIPSGRPLLLYGHRRVREASCSLDEIRSNLNEIRSNLDEIRSLPDDIRVESGYLDLEKQLRYDLYNWRPNAKKFMRLNRRKDSNSESDDSCPPSPGCSFTEGFSSKLFDPDYVPKVDKWSRILFPLAFVVFNIVYWAYHLN